MTHVLTFIPSELEREVVRLGDVVIGEVAQWEPRARDILPAVAGMPIELPSGAIDRGSQTHHRPRGRRMVAARRHFLSRPGG